MYPAEPVPIALSARSWCELQRIMTLMARGDTGGLRQAGREVIDQRQGVAEVRDAAEPTRLGEALTALAAAAVTLRTRLAPTSHPGR